MELAGLEPGRVITAANGWLEPVDGGINADNVEEVRNAGADLVVAGTSVFGNGNVARSYQELAAKLSRR
jgi:pentose-5-phosphate-3-epimerase